MLQKTFKRKRAVWAGMAAVPLLALVIFAFSSRNFEPTEQSPVQNQQDTVPESDKSTISTNKKDLPPDIADYKMSGVTTKEGERSTVEITFKDGNVLKETINSKEDWIKIEKKYGLKLPPPPPPPAQQKGASQKEMEEYRAILKEMTIVNEDGTKSYKYIDGKTQRAAKIYSKMTETQRTTVEMMPPPPPSPPPKVEAKMYVPVEARMYVPAPETKKKNEAKPFNRVIIDDEVYTLGEAKSSDKNDNNGKRLGTAEHNGNTQRNAVRHVLNDNELQTQP